jgi:hypothetical protein
MEKASEEQKELARVTEQTVIQPERATAMETPAKSEHGSLPWRLNGRWSGVNDAKGRVVFIDRHTAVADAELIVLAVNHHDELVSALCRLVESLGSDFLAERVPFSYEAARAVLAKVK